MIKIRVLVLNILFLSQVQETLAHPGIGLVTDSKGNFYFTDLKQIWKQTPEGQRTIAVANVHSHELYMDKNDNLFGEHLWYVPASDKSYKYQWCLKSSGELTRLTSTMEAWGVPKTFSFVRDNIGNMYWYEDSAKNKVHFIKSDASGNKVIIASGTFNDIRWMFSTPQGEIYFLDLDELYRITADHNFQLIAKNLCVGTLWTVFFGKQHSVFGIWFDKSGNTYAAVGEDNCIKKISPAGEVIIVYKSNRGAPLNGLFDKTGNLWVLDGEKVSKVTMTEISKTKVWYSNNRIYIYALLGIAALILLIKKLKTAFARK